MPRKPTTPPVNVQVIPIADLIPDPNNLRNHGPRNQAASRASLRTFGAARSIVADGDNVVRAGNETLASAKEAGIREALVIDADGDQLVVVRRKGWDDKTARAYGLADNRVGDLDSEFDPDRVKAAVADLEAQDFPVADLALDFQPWEFGDVTPLDDTTSNTDPAAGAVEKFEKFAKSNVKTITMALPLEQYKWAVETLTLVCEEFGVESNTDAIIYLLRAYEDGRIRPAPDADAGNQDDAAFPGSPDGDA